MRILVSLLLTMALPAMAADYVVTTLAGNGTEGFAGDGGSALCAMLNRPTGVDVDARGNVYIADYSNDRVRRVAPDGTISTVAGTGTRGFSGDGGNAVAAQLAGPYGVRVVSNGLLIADAVNGRIRHVDETGVIRTIAGGGPGPEIGDGGPAVQARLQHPIDVIQGPEGSLFVAEGGGNRVRRIRADGIIETFAGTGALRYNGQSALTGDRGPAVRAQLNVPAALALDGMGNLYIADLRNHVVRKVGGDGIITTAVRGDGLEQPGGLAVESDGSLLISDLHGIRRLTPDGKVVKVAGGATRGFYGDHGPALNAQFAVLDLMTIDANGVVLVADHRNNRIRKLTPARNAVPSSAIPPPASAEVEDLLAKMRSAYQSIGSARMRYTTRNRHRSTRGVLEYRSPLTVNATLDVENYGKVSVVSDGRSITVVDPMLQAPESLGTSLPNLRTAVGANLEVISLWDWQRQLNTGDGGNMSAGDLTMGSPQSWRGRRWIILNEKGGTDSYRYYIDPRTHLMWRTVASDASGSVFYEGAVDDLRITAR